MGCQCSRSSWMHHMVFSLFITRCQISHNQNRQENFEKCLVIRNICQPRLANELVGQQACYIYSASVHLASNKMRPELEKYMNYTFKSSWLAWLVLLFCSAPWRRYLPLRSCPQPR